MSKLSRHWRRLRQAVQEWAGATYELDGCGFVLPAWAGLETLGFDIVDRADNVIVARNRNWIARN